MSELSETLSSEIDGILNGTVMFLDTMLGLIAPDQSAAGTSVKVMNRRRGIRKRNGRLKSTFNETVELINRSVLRENGEKDAERWKERLTRVP